jgi:hypothetical protein
MKIRKQSYFHTFRYELFWMWIFKVMVLLAALVFIVMVWFKCS